MTPIQPFDMLKATQLTRQGRLADATRLIRQLFAGGTPDAPHAPSPHITVDGTAERIGEPGVESSRARRADLAGSGDAATASNAFAGPTWTEALHGFPIAHGLPTPSLRHRPARPTPAVPEGAQFVTRRFAAAAGSREYKLYVPSRYRGEPLPLVVMLHGCTQSADDFANGTRMNEVAEENCLLVAYPMQAKSANVSGCWNWFKPGDQERHGGEPSLIAGITQTIARDYSVDADRIYVAGLSAGGAAAAIMGAVYPDVFAAVGVHSGLPVGAASDIPSALAAMRQGSTGTRKVSGSAERRAPVPTIVFHGDRDTTVHPSNGSHIIEQIRSARAGDLRAVSHRGQAPAGRAYSRTRHLDAADRAVMEMWVLHGAGHAWSGGSAAGSYTDVQGPDASREMVRFFLQNRRVLPVL